MISNHLTLNCNRLTFTLTDVHSISDKFRLVLLSHSQSRLIHSLCYFFLTFNDILSNPLSNLILQSHHEIAETQ